MSAKLYFAVHPGAALSIAATLLERPSLYKSPFWLIHSCLIYVCLAVEYEFLDIITVHQFKQNYVYIRKKSTRQHQFYQRLKYIINIWSSQYSSFALKRQFLFYYPVHDGSEIPVSWVSGAFLNFILSHQLNKRSEKSAYVFSTVGFAIHSTGLTNLRQQIIQRLLRPVFVKKTFW